MKRAVYIETTIPSFYVETRQQPSMVARKESTRSWWEDEAGAYDLYISAFVLGELNAGEFPGRSEAIELVTPLPLLEVVPEIGEIAEVYMKRQLMPREDAGDAYHLATASYYAMDFVLTWNCRHLANANKAKHIGIVNAELGLPVPIITTPDLLI